MSLVNRNANSKAKRSIILTLLLLLLSSVAVGSVRPVQGSFTSVSASPPAQSVPTFRTFPETGKTVRGRFLQFWQENGGLAQFGYPISDEMGEGTVENGLLLMYTVQYFERAVFQYHPEHLPPNDVQLILLGSFAYQQSYPNGASGQVPNASDGSVYFAETNRKLGGTFFNYWKSHGGLRVQGLPLTDEFTEVSHLDGKPYRVQYFERAVYEFHPENPATTSVQLSQLGTYRFKATYPNSSTILPPPIPVPSALQPTPTPTHTPRAAPTPTATRVPAPPPPAPPPPSSGGRCGAICEDGWVSSATGSGACSHHGGVDHWLYCDLVQP